MAGLVTLAEAEAYLNVTSDSGGPIDTIITGLIGAMADAFDRMTNRALREATYTHQMDGRGVHALMARQFPVTTLTSIKSDPNWVFGAGTLVPAAEVIVDQGLILVNINTWTQGIRNYQLIYVAGYSLATMPQDLKEATYLAVEFFYRMRSSERLGVQSKTKIGENVTYLDLMPEFIKTMVMGYSREQFYKDAVAAGG